MFTGIVQAVGRISEINEGTQDVRLVIDAGALGLGDVALGDSIAVNGVCLTVIELTDHTFSVDVSRETLNCTEGLNAKNEVNLEKALRLADRLGGHLMSGHVDGVGEVVKFAPIGESWHLEIRVPHTLAKYIAPKGSVTVNGVSLTINRVSGAEFSINLIPHTLEVTVLKHLQVGTRVNIEVDLLARYVERLLAYRDQSDKD
jgi:riboflavin synthase